MEIQEFHGEYSGSNGQRFDFWTYGIDAEDARNNAHRLYSGSSVFNLDEAISRADIKASRRIER